MTKHAMEMSWHTRALLDYTVNVLIVRMYA